MKSGGTVIIGIARDPRTLDPAYAGGPEGRRLVCSMMDALVDLDADSKPFPQLAERWETPDPRTVLFRLRPGIKFHDGTDVDAEAVKFNFDRNLDPVTKSARKGELLAVDGVDVVDKLTAKVRLKTPSSSFISLLFDRPGFMLSPTAAKKWANNDFGIHPVGAGPFRFVSYEKDVQTVVERNPDYWDKGKPLVDRIIFRVIPNQETRLTELRTGGIHIAENLPFQDVSRVELPRACPSGAARRGTTHWTAIRSPSPSSSERDSRRTARSIRARRSTTRATGHSRATSRRRRTCSIDPGSPRPRASS